MIEIGISDFNDQLSTTTTTTTTTSSTTTTTTVIPTPPPIPPVSKVNTNAHHDFLKTQYRNNKPSNNISSIVNSLNDYFNYPQVLNDLENTNFPLDPFLFSYDIYEEVEDSYQINLKTFYNFKNTTTSTSLTTTITTDDQTTTINNNTTMDIMGSPIHSLPKPSDSPLALEYISNTPGECPICLDSQDTMVSFPFCHHTYCNSCTEAHLREQVWRYKGKKLCCPYPKCNYTVLHDEKFYSLYLDSVSLEKLKLYKIIVGRVYGEYDIMFCISCDHPIQRLDQSNETIVCDNVECQLEMCYSCGTVSHPDKTCQENKDYILENLSEDEKKSLKYLESEQYKACPKCGIQCFKEDGCEYVCCLSCGHQFCYFCLEPHDHNLSTHVHGPNYIAPKHDTYYNYAYGRRRGFFQRHYHLKQAATAVAVGLGAIIFGPPVVVIGAIPYATYRAVTHIKRVVKQRKNMNKKCNFDNWIVEEKKRREAMNLEVSDYIVENYNKINTNQKNNHNHNNLKTK